jgi:hypothetical protein
MQATHSWGEPIATMPRSKREWSFALIRTVIIVSVVGAAAWFLAIAYAPQWFAPRSPLQALNCPPLAVIDRETVVSPQAFVTSAQAQDTRQRQPCTYRQQHGTATAECETTGTSN